MERVGNACALGLTLLLLAFHHPSVAQRVGPEGRVRVIAFGDVIDQYGSYNSFTIVRFDPAIRYYPVPSRPDLVTLEVARRNLRLYMPRTYERLINDYDVITTSDAYTTMFRPDWIEWMSRAVTDGGLRFEWLGTFASLDEKNWWGTTLAEIAPVQPALEYTIPGHFRLKIHDWDEALMRALPWEEAPATLNLNTQIPKEGSRVWAFTDHPEGYPFMTYWRIGKGAVLNFASKFPNGVEPWARGWRYFPQAMIYMVYRIADKRLPEDPVIFEEVTRLLLEYNEIRSYLVQLLSFVEGFGGRVEGLHRTLGRLDLEKFSADQCYLAGDFAGCLRMLTELRQEQRVLSQAAIEARREALLWIYVVEWCSLLATFMVSGFVVWSLMVRRRLYKEVGTSRLLG